MSMLYADPSTLQAVLAAAKSGDTIILADGTYTGPAGMIQLHGQADLTIRAANDGAVLIDGEGQRVPISLRQCVRVSIEGLDACRSSASVVDVSYSQGCQIRRVCGWVAAEGNNVIFGVHYSSDCLIEDCAGWGRARKIFTCGQGSYQTTFRRCWGRWEGCHSVGPKHTFEGQYNSRYSTFENCIGTWDTSTGLMDQPYTLLGYDGQPWKGAYAGTYQPGQTDQCYGIFAETALGVAFHDNRSGTRFLGCIAYVLPHQRAEFVGGLFVTRCNGVEVRNCHVSIAGGQRAVLLARNDRQADGGSDLVVAGLAHYGGPVIIDPAWQASGVCERMPLPKTAWRYAHQGDASGDGNVDVADLGIVSAHYGSRAAGPGEGDLNRDGHCNVGDIGIVSANYRNAMPLWPWPMEDRIKARCGVSVTAQVQEALCSAAS